MILPPSLADCHTTYIMPSACLDTTGATIAGRPTHLPSAATHDVLMIVPWLCTQVQKDLVPMGLKVRPLELLLLHNLRILLIDGASLALV